jgi:hypothetical protein
VLHQELYLAEREIMARVHAVQRSDEPQRSRRQSDMPGRLLGRVALLLVALGARLVLVGLPPGRPAAEERSRERGLVLPA